MKGGPSWDSEGESQYLASVSDLMAGLLFVFVLLMTAFAIRLADQRQQEEEDRDRTKEHRTELLTTLRDSLETFDLRIELDLEQGVLHLGAEVLFPSGKDEPDSRSLKNLAHLARILAAVVPKYTDSHDSDDTKKHVDALFVEGHTDSIPLARGSRFRDNWELSALRSIAVFKELVTVSPVLSELRNRDEQPILSVSGYAAGRPRTGSSRPTDIEKARARDRRIDLRFIMESPFETEPAQETREEYKADSRE